MKRAIILFPLLIALVFCCGCSSRSIPDEPKEDDAPIASEAEPGIPGDNEASEPEQNGSVDDQVDESEPTAEDGVMGEVVADNVYTGTCVIVSTEELLEMQGQLGDGTAFGADPYYRYALVLLDPPQMLLARFAGDPYEFRYESAGMICVAIEGRKAEGDLSFWEPYDGMQVTIQIDHMSTWYPSDARLPLGTPHTDTARLISAENSGS